MAKTEIAFTIYTLANTGGKTIFINPCEVEYVEDSNDKKTFIIGLRSGKKVEAMGCLAEDGEDTNLHQEVGHIESARIGES